MAYDGMERFFPADKIMKTGNPVRQNIVTTDIAHDEAVRMFGLDPTKKTILIVGGSLGARTVKPVILVPSPNVAEDHQTKNAMALVNKDAALMVKDVDAPQEVISLALATVMDEKKLCTLSENVKKLGLPASADIIADEVLKLAEKK